MLPRQNGRHNTVFTVNSTSVQLYRSLPACESKCGIARHMKEKLLKQSTDAAQRAIRHYLKNEFDQFFIQAGIS
jgi:hypothetical protein